MKAYLPGSVDTVVSSRPFCEVVAVTVSAPGNKLTDELVIVRTQQLTRHSKANGPVQPETRKRPQRQPTARKSNPVPVRPRKLKKGSINNGAGNSGGGGATMTPKLGALDANVYATKKTIAQGLLDVALLTANASQLKYLLQAGSEHEFYYVMMVLIILSIILQVLTGCLMLLVANTNLNDPKKQTYANRMNNAVTIGVFLVAILNILISALGIKNSDDVQNTIFSQL